MENNKNIKERKKYGKLRMMVDFTKGSRAMFAFCVIATALSAFADMLTPQIIRTSIDYVIPNSAAGANASCV